LLGAAVWRVEAADAGVYLTQHQTAGWRWTCALWLC